MGDGNAFTMAVYIKTRPVHARDMSSRPAYIQYYGPLEWIISHEQLIDLVCMLTQYVAAKSSVVTLLQRVGLFRKKPIGLMELAWPVVSANSWLSCTKSLMSELRRAA